MPVSQSISVPYVSNVTNETCLGIGIGAHYALSARLSALPSIRAPSSRGLHERSFAAPSRAAAGRCGPLESRAAMDLLEYQGKQLFARHGLRVSDGRAVTAVDD